MSSEPRAFLALDLGTATASAALLGWIDGRWRLIGSRAAPATVPLEALIARLVDRLVAVDPALMAGIGVPDTAATADLVRLVARSRPAPRLAVLAGSDRMLARLRSIADRSGFRVNGLSAERADSLEITRLVLDRDVGTVLLGADDPPGADERARLSELGQLLAAAAWRRRELRIVLAGGARDLAGVIDPDAVDSAEVSAPSGTGIGEAPPAADSDAPDRNAEVLESDDLTTDGDAASTRGPDAAGDTPDGETGPRPEGSAGAAAPIVDSAGSAASPALAAEASNTTEPSRPADAAGPSQVRNPGTGDGPGAAGDAPPLRTGSSGGSDRLVRAPAPADGRDGDALRSVLEDLRAAPDDARLATARAVATLAEVLQLRIELVEIGNAAGQHVTATPVGEGTDGPPVRVETATVADAALVPVDAGDDHVDDVLAWSTTTLDRYRLRDRLRELGLAPWADATGEGALVRVAAARAAIGRLLHATASAPGARSAIPAAPDLVIAAGGTWATVPGPVVALALADLVRRPGVCQSALDSSRLLGPLGTIEDERDRIRVLRDLADDILVPLGSVITPQGVRPGRNAGRLTMRDDDEAVEHDLVAGGLQLIDLPPGSRATVALAFRDPVVLGSRGREFDVDVAGGLSGLIVDLRDVPLRLPERSERRRELLGAWQRALWGGLE